MNALDFSLDAPAPPPSSRLRETLARRLVDTVCMPQSRISPHERLMAADLLIEVLRHSDDTLRARAAQRLASLAEAPSLVLRFLARDRFDIARPILDESNALDTFDLIQIANVATTDHRVAIACRKEVPEPLADALARFGEITVVEALVRNRNARLADSTLDVLLTFARAHPEIIKTLCRRDEVRPSDAAVLFWWADAQDRLYILKRFSPERQVLHEGATDLFARAASEGWNDPLVRTTLQFIERRQRSRDALARSQFDSLEAAVDAAQPRITKDLAWEIAHLAGVRPATLAQIALDPGGEGVAVICKATGLRKPYLAKLWKGLGRATGEGANHSPAFERILLVYDSLSPAKAQTMLRYWNWALTSAMSPQSARDADPAGEDLFAFNPAARAASLVFGDTRR